MAAVGTRKDGEWVGPCGKVKPATGGVAQIVRLLREGVHTVAQAVWGLRPLRSARSLVSSGSPLRGLDAFRALGVFFGRLGYFPPPPTNGQLP